MGESSIWTPGGERPVGGEPPRGQAAGSAGAPPEAPDDRELLEQLRRLPVAELVLAHAGAYAQLAAIRLDLAEPDLPAARLAIEALRALLGVGQGTFPAQAVAELRAVLADLQLAYAGAAGAAQPAGPGEDAAAAAD